MDMRYAYEHCHAIVQAWYPGGEGGTAIAELLFGRFSPSGRLPVTFYRETSDLPDFTDYSMKNRTYRYFSGTPLYPFGYGLSYTAFTYKRNGIKETDAGYEVSVDITNTGAMDGLEKPQLYAEPLNVNFTVPKYELRAYSSVYLTAGETKTVTLYVRKQDLRLVDGNGRYTDHDKFIFYVGGGQPDGRTRELTKNEPVIFEIGKGH